MAAEVERTSPGMEEELSFTERLEKVPWWLVIILCVITLMGYLIARDPDYNDAFQFIVTGVSFTAYLTVASFAASLVVGLIAGVGRISDNMIFRNLATAYIEFIRGVPIIILILVVGTIIVPRGLESFGLPPAAIRPAEKAIAALTLIYGAFVAEIFRAGIDSVPRGQMEAARSLGMGYLQAMRHIVLPQAIRNMLPALGNDFIALLKDSSLVSVLAVREITQLSRLYAGSSFRYEEAFFTATLLYLIITLILSLLLQWYQKRLRIDG